MLSGARLSQGRPGVILAISRESKPNVTESFAGPSAIDFETLMSKTYDASSKAVIQTSPEAWLRLAGYEPRGLVEVVNVDLSAVTSAADYAIKVENGESAWVAHIEFVSGHQSGLNQDLALRNALLNQREGCPARTIVILLHPNAYRPELSGSYETRIDGEPQLALRYRVVKIYEHGVDEPLAGPAGIVPAAVLSREIKERDQVGPVLTRLHDRLTEELGENASLIKNLWTTAELYLGLKFKGKENKGWIKTLTRGVLSVKDSIIYQDILDEGRIAGRVDALIHIILHLGAERWGQPSEGEKVALEAISDAERLERMGSRLLAVSSWDDLLGIK